MCWWNMILVIRGVFKKRPVFVVFAGWNIIFLKGKGLEYRLCIWPRQFESFPKKCVSRWICINYQCQLLDNEKWPMLTPTGNVFLSLTMKKRETRRNRRGLGRDKFVLISQAGSFSNNVLSDPSLSTCTHVSPALGWSAGPNPHWKGKKKVGRREMS